MKMDMMLAEQGFCCDAAIATSYFAVSFQWAGLVIIVHVPPPVLLPKKDIFFMLMIVAVQQARWSFLTLGYWFSRCPFWLHGQRLIVRIHNPRNIPFLMI
jgi:hypothetical protein